VKPAYVFSDALVVDLRVGPDIRDITAALERMVKDVNVVDGVLYATVVGSTGSITTIEYEPGVVQDLKDAIERMAPQDFAYAHEQAWHDGNGHSHVQAALIGPSITVAVRNGRLRLGTWQQVVVINHDNRPRRRHIEVTITGSIDKDVP
jgi:secondary thiamine-phosphate synthase enzyme